jgi:L-ascorbate metabolism protein UlaG (beta-lactamase superfamily)
MTGEVVFQWLGTAGFRIWHRGKVILIDPYLTRNDAATPKQQLKPSDMEDTDFIFISHGHFDHLFDVPAIIRASGATVYCNEVASRTLQRQGVPTSSIKAVSGGESLDLDTFKVAVTAGKHIRFDAALIINTFPGIVRERRVLRRMDRMPAGTVLTTMFDMDGLKFMHVGSLGLKADQAGKLRLGIPDILMLPVQGHTDICRRAATVAAALRPRAVIAEHHDNFFPPISKTIDIEPLRRMLAELLPECSFYEPEMNRRFTPKEVFSNT